MIDATRKNARRALQLHIDSRECLLRVELLVSDQRQLAQWAVRDAVAEENQKIAAVRDRLRQGNEFRN
ncbi:hypothetical protein [Devosia sp.]|uniref:hypothetical protein n=1 Tax=Devosia sp. TaxID=1871048 RepID=UPI003F6FF432